MEPFFRPPAVIANSADNNASIVLHHGDALAFCRTLPSESIHLIVTSPPYNLGKAYETRRAIEHYLSDQEALLNDLVRVLHPRGSLCWQVGNFVEDGEVFPLDMYYYPMFKHLGLKLRNRIIWHFGHGLHASKRFSGRYETLLWFSKTDDYTFNLDPVRIPSKYPGKRHYKGDKRGQPSGNPNGKNPSDMWEVVAQDWETCLWDVPNVKANHPEKTTHPCQFPVEVVERCVLALTNIGDRVFDPFVGVGTSLIAGLIHERVVIGCDKHAEYISIARDRIESYNAGTLKVRPLGRPVHQPSGRERITQRPLEWDDEDSTS